MSTEERPSVRLRVITPEQVEYDGPVDWVQIPLEDGLLGVWPGHAPLVASTSWGQIEFSAEGEVHVLPIGAGVLRIDGTHCVILYGATATSPEPERDLEGLALRLEETLYERLSDRELEDLQ